MLTLLHSKKPVLLRNKPRFSVFTPALMIMSFLQDLMPTKLLEGSTMLLTRPSLEWPFLSRPLSLPPMFHRLRTCSSGTIRAYSLPLRSLFKTDGSLSATAMPNMETIMSLSSWALTPTFVGINTYQSLLWVTSMLMSPSSFFLPLKMLALGHLRLRPPSISFPFVPRDEMMPLKLLLLTTFYLLLILLNLLCLLA